MADLEAEVVVVGSGPTGAAVTWRLATAGLKVICLEKGGWLPVSDLGRDLPDWELRRAREWSSNPNIRCAPEDDPVDDEDTPIKPMIASTVGGTSPHWSAHVPRFRPEDFRVRSLDGVADDWPISYEDLAPYYALNEERWGVAAIPGDPSSPPHGEGALKLPTIGAHGRRVAAAFDRLGWHWWPVDLVVGRDADLPGTVHCTHIGPCDLGCPSRIRSSADRGYMIDAVEAGARLLTRVRVTTLEHDSRRSCVCCGGGHGRQDAADQRKCFRIGCQRVGDAAPPAAFRERAVPEWVGQLLGPHRPKPDAPSIRPH